MSFAYGEMVKVRMMAVVQRLLFEESSTLLSMIDRCERVHCVPLTQILAILRAVLSRLLTLSYSKVFHNINI